MIPGSGSPGEGHGNPLQYYCLENSIEQPGGLGQIGSHLGGCRSPCRIDRARGVGSVEELERKNGFYESRTSSLGTGFGSDRWRHRQSQTALTTILDCETLRAINILFEICLSITA